MKKLIGSVLILALATQAHADEGTVASGGSVAVVAHWLLQLKSGKYTAQLSTDYLVKKESGNTQCLDEIELVRRNGWIGFQADEFEHFGGKPDGHNRWVITLEQADKICREGSLYRDVVLTDLALFRDLDIDVDWMIKNGVRESYVESLKPTIERCPAAVDALLAAKLDPSFPYPVGTAKTIADLKPEVCERAKQNVATFLKTLGEKDAKARAPYLKVGIKGDKLDLMLEYGNGVYLAGQRAPDSLKPYAAASVLFTWSTSDPDAMDYVVHTVRRYAFKGNKLIKTTDKTYSRQRGATLGGGVFK